MKTALIDMGSNTIRLSVYLIKDGGFELLFSEKQMAGLVNYVSNGIMSEEGMIVASNVVKDFKDILALFNMSDVNVFATASLRNLRNTEEAVNFIEKEAACCIDVISGEEEARLSYIGALQSQKLDNGAMFDIGGGSTELVRVVDGEIKKAKSVQMGSLSLFKNHVDKVWPKKAEIVNLTNAINKALTEATFSRMPAETLCGVGGTARALLKMANILFEKNENNRRISERELDELVKCLVKQDKEARSLILRACPDRMHTIIPGAILANRICKIVGAREVVVSKYGVREGYLCQKIIKSAI